MNKLSPFNIPLLLLIFVMSSCGAGAKKTQDKTEKTVSIPVFNTDSAYLYVESQTLFGPRVPNSEAHEACRKYIVSNLQKTGAKITEQSADLKAFDGTNLKSTNIIASFQPENPNRILLCAHWDSRPWADNDPNEKNWHTPISGANDGASGVGVLMEIARQLGIETAKGNKPKAGIDILFFDAEDYGEPKFHQGTQNEDSWCLGTQYWAKNPHTPGYKAKYGILLDMVGGKAPNFQWDYYSSQYAPQILQAVWKKAAALGYNNYFKEVQGGSITDDHVYINKLAKIPCIDIIDYDPDSKTGFVPYWHTLDDTMKNIDKTSLKIVGETLLNMVYDE
ncbi:MAG: M28 family peptidase [Bacteroidales bacterium]|nr:M28 family peptidase [Bacteroidales bacterium]